MQLSLTIKLELFLCGIRKQESHLNATIPQMMNKKLQRKGQLDKLLKN